jgi:hypothetical protein
MMKNCLRIAAMVAMVAMIAAIDAPDAKASIITYSGDNSPGSLAAEVTFDNSVSGTLTVTLSNVGGDILVPVDVLTGVFFDLSAGSGLTKVSAVVAPGSAIIYDTDGNPVTLTAGTSVAGEWAYKTGLGGSSPGNTGISSSGLGLFGPTDRFSTAAAANLEGPADPDGLQYGLFSANDNPATGNSAVSDDGNNDAFIKNSVVFTFSTTGVFDLDRISNVSFQYGTALTEPNIPGEPPDEVPPPVPEPSTLLMGAVAMVGLGFARFRGSKKS